MESNTVLVLGATGGIGSEMARQLRDAGWQVRALKRGADPAQEHREGIDWIRGDAMNRDDVVAAAKGCSAIVHAVNPPGYRRWAELVLPMIDNTIAAAIAHGATVVLPGTIYNYGADAFPSLREDSPQKPATHKGAIRVEMERRLQAASARGCRTIVVRAGDFFGPKMGNSWFSQGLVKPGLPATTVSLPGKPGVGHQWSYLPDVARTMVELLQHRAALAPFETFHMAGHWDEGGRQMGEAISRVVARRTGVTPKLKPFAWLLVTLATPFVATLRELREMRYLWNEPLRMGNERLTAVLGREPHTPLDEAVEATLEGMGCLATPAPKPSAAGVAALAATMLVAGLGAAVQVDDARATPVPDLHCSAPVSARDHAPVEAPVATRRS